jgi:Domain of unknown function (DUF4258)
MSKRYDIIEYVTPHAYRSMQKRKVSVRQVERCIQAPHRESPSKTHSGNLEAEYDTEFSTLVVWYEVIGPRHAKVWSCVRRSK